MTRLDQLFDEQGQSPWLDNLKRGWITSGELAGWVDRGVRGITSNPSIFQNAISASEAYDDQLGRLVNGGASIEDSYWSLVKSDIEEALEILAPVYDASSGEDGYVSVEVAPALARDTDATADAARLLHGEIDEPNLYVKIPGTAEGLPAIRQMIGEGNSINVTLIFSLDRYRGVIEAYLAGLEARVAGLDGDLAGDDTSTDDISSISSVASFFISRVDTEVDRRLESIGTDAALALRGRTAVAQGQIAYKIFSEAFSGARWDALQARGARVQRPLWASTSTKNPAYRDTLYVDELIGPDTVNTLPDGTIAAFEHHGVVGRTIDADFDGAQKVLDDVSEVGVDLEDVARQLESEGVAAFEKSFDELLATLDGRAEDLRS